MLLLVPPDLEFAACVRISHSPSPPPDEDHHHNFHHHPHKTKSLHHHDIQIFSVRDNGEATKGFGERVTYFTNKVSKENDKQCVKKDKQCVKTDKTSSSLRTHNIQLWSQSSIRAGWFQKGGGFVQIGQVNLSQGMSPDDLSSYL